MSVVSLFLIYSLSNISTEIRIKVLTYRQCTAYTTGPRDLKLETMKGCENLTLSGCSGKINSRHRNHVSLHCPVKIQQSNYCFYVSSFNTIKNTILSSHIHTFQTSNGRFPGPRSASYKLFHPHTYVSAPESIKTHVCSAFYSYFMHISVIESAL